jgi:DNA-binding protein YbaB
VVAGEERRVERPDPSAVLNLMQDLNKTLDNMATTQREMLSVTGTAWSDDRTIKAVVGPRGQLIDLEIDPRVYRKPNSKVLAATIVTTIRAAVDQAIAQTQEIVERAMPQVKDVLRPGAPGTGIDVRRVLRSHDADLKKIVEEANDVDLP